MKQLMLGLCFIFGFICICSLAIKYSCAVPKKIWKVVYFGSLFLALVFLTVYLAAVFVIG